MSETTVRGDNFAMYQAGPMTQWDQFRLEPPAVPIKIKGKHFLKDVLGSHGLEISLNAVPPGRGMPFFHKHQENDEVYIVIGGRGQFLVDGRCLDVEEGSVIRMSPSAVRAYRNHSEQTMYFLCLQYRADSAICGGTSDGKGVEEKPVWPETISAPKENRSMSDLAKMTKAQQDDGSVTPAELIVQYEQGVSELRSAVAGMAVEQLRARPIPGKWSTLEVVCHMADAEQFFADRMKRTIGTDRPLLIGVDNVGYSEPLGYQEHDLNEELDLIDITRRQMARALRLIDESVWQRVAVHSETGLMNLRQLILHPIRHLRHHLPFITEKRAAMR